MVFQPLFNLNNEYGGILKGSVPPLREVERAQPPCCLCNLGFWWPRPHNLVSSWGISLAAKLKIVGIAGPNMQWGHFVCPSSSQKRENTAFDLILWSAWGLSSPGKQVGRSTQCSTPCRKRSHVWGRESERWPKYMQQSRQCWKWEEFRKTTSIL